MPASPPGSTRVERSAPAPGSRSAGSPTGWKTYGAAPGAAPFFWRRLIQPDQLLLALDLGGLALGRAQRAVVVGVEAVEPGEDRCTVLVGSDLAVVVLVELAQHRGTVGSARRLRGG